MLIRLRNSWFATSGALLLVLYLSGAVAATALVTAIAPAGSETTEPDPATDTTLTFEDIDGNNVDDDCQTDAAVADPEAAAAAQLAADLNADGVISTSEAARSARIGGKNCNHGGYVSSVARGLDTAPTDAAAAPAQCEAGAAPTTEETTLSDEPNAHGKAVSDVANSDAVGGKNCNHGGAVSTEAKNNHGHGQSAAAQAGKQHGHGHGKP